MRPSRLYDVLSSPRAAVAIASALALATAAAVTLRALDPAPASAALRRLAQVFEAADPFRSWWYSLVWVAAVTAAFAHLVEGVRAARDPSPLFRLRASVPGPQDEAPVRALLRLHARKMWMEEDGTIVAERGGSSRLARAVTASGALLLCAGIAVASHLGTSGLVALHEGATAYDMMRPTSAGPLRYDLGAELEAHPREGEEGRWRVAVARGADVLAEARVAVGDSFEADGRRFRLTAARWGRAPGRFLLGVAGGEPRLVRPGEPIAAGSARAAVSVLGAELGPSARQGPAVRLAWSAQERGRPETGWVFARYPEYDARVRRSSPPVQFAGFERKMELTFRVEEPAGRVLLGAGGAIVLAGLLLFAGPALTRFTARRRDTGWEITAEGGRGAASLAGEIDALASRLRGIGRP